MVTSSSQGDWRFIQWLRCFAILFNITVDAIMEDFESLRGDIKN